MKVSTLNDASQAAATVYIVNAELDISQLPDAVQPFAQHAVEEDEFKGKCGTLVAYPSLGSVRSKLVFIVGAGEGTTDGGDRGN